MTEREKTNNFEKVKECLFVILLMSVVLGIVYYFSRFLEIPEILLNKGEAKYILIAFWGRVIWAIIALIILAYVVIKIIAYFKE